MSRLLFATRNRGKLRELEAIFAELFSMGALERFEVQSLDELEAPIVEEDQPTFAGNAEKKARSAFLATGIPALADDSGLEVDALGGAPGVRSARFASDAGTAIGGDAANNAALLAALAEVSDERRGARFRCVLAFVDGDGPALFSEGVCSGRIARAPRGAGGFGYDPLFLVDGTGGRTAAELTRAEKNRLSHRGQALRVMANALAAHRRIP